MDLSNPVSTIFNYLAVLRVVVDFLYLITNQYGALIIVGNSCLILLDVSI